MAGLWEETMNGMRERGMAGVSPQNAASTPASSVLSANTPNFAPRNGTLNVSRPNTQPADTGQKGPRVVGGGGGAMEEARNALLARITNGDRFQAASAARALAAMGGGLQKYGQNATELTKLDESARQFDVNGLMQSRDPAQSESLFNRLADRQGISRQMGDSIYGNLSEYNVLAGAGKGGVLQEPTAAAQYTYSYGPGGEQGTAANPVGARMSTPGYQPNQFMMKRNADGTNAITSFGDGSPLQGGGTYQSPNYQAPGSMIQWTEKKAYGGEVMGTGMPMGYASGGMVGSPSGAMDVAGAGNPMQAIMSSYPAYLKAMAKSKSKDKPMSMEAYIKAAMTAVSKKMQQRQARGAMPEAGPNPVMGFANGGAVDIAGKLLDGPGHERSDSIPAVVDGNKAAAVSKGEFVIPKHVVEYFGTKHFDSLLEKARMAMKKGKAAAGA